MNYGLQLWPIWQPNVDVLSSLEIILKKVHYASKFKLIPLTDAPKHIQRGAVGKAMLQN